MFGSSTPGFGVPSGTSPFGSSSTFGQNSNSTPSTGLFGASSSTFGPRPSFGSGFGALGSSSGFHQNSSSTSSGASIFGGTSTGVFGNSYPTFGSKSPFGAPSTTAFGSPTPTSGAFPPPAFGSGAFGLSSGFNQNSSSTSPGASVFGGTSTGVFGTSSPTFGSNSSFGAPSNTAFGSPIPTSGALPPPAFGSGAFGSSSGFNQNISSTSPGASVFGGTSTGVFGTSSPTFGSKSLFGAPSNTAFGSPTPTFGALPPPAFGIQSTTHSNGSTSFGPSNFFNQPQGSRNVAYTSTDFVEGTYKLQLQSISSMPAYKEKCHEELRWEDYQSGDKGPMGVGGSPAQSSPFPTSSTVPSTPTNPFLLINPSTPHPSQSSFAPSSSPNPFAQKSTPNPFAQKSTPNPFAPESSQNQNPFAPSSSPNPFAPSNSPNPFAQKSTPNPFAPQVSTSPFAPVSSSNPFPGSSPSPFAPNSSTSFAPNNGSSGPFAPKNSSTPGVSTNLFAPSSLSNPFAPNLTSAPTVPESTSSLGPTSFTNLFKTTPNPVSPVGTTSFPIFSSGITSSSSGFCPGISPISTQSSGLSMSVGAAGVQPAPMMSPFGTLPAMPELSIGHRQSTTPIHYGISSMPVLDKTAAPTRLSPLISCHRLSQRRTRLPVRKYDPSSDCPKKVPFYSNEDYTHTATDVEPQLFPRENPRALVINPAASLLQRPIITKKMPFNVCNDGDGASEADEVAVEEGQEINIEELMPKLRLSDYYTEPTIQELAVKERAEPGFTRRVNNFVVGRHGYGSIKFLGETNVEKLELDSIVEFNYREVLVYAADEEDKKPPVGEGLNKAAEVTLLNIKCMGKKSGKQHVEGPMVDEYKQRLMKKATEQGAEFVSYDPVLGEWKFRVPHFSSS